LAMLYETHSRDAEAGVTARVADAMIGEFPPCSINTLNPVILSMGARRKIRDSDHMAVGISIDESAQLVFRP
jgi:hypothetical protein